MNEKILNRADSTIDVDDFRRLTSLHLDHEWLTYEPDALFELWCLSDEENQKQLIEFLINNYEYIDSKKLTKGCQTISEHIQNEWKLSSKNSFLLATCDDKEPDGSQSLIQNLKNKFSVEWKASNFYNSLPTGVHEVPDDSTIILVDDFIGTGNTINRKLNYVNKVITERKLKNIDIKIVSLASMLFAKEALDKLNVEYFSVYWLKKGISESHPEENRDDAVKSMEALEKKLKRKYHGKYLPKFGYQKSESLFALESYNVPNNVFPIFWWPFLKGGIPRKTIFKRV
ncbi:hypothetical protein D778_00003 [Xanthomarina gelatinilytica]|uniref:PRTase-CE domain-containing protein n=1 Tax=Xanthomarina gelatinilytica TaxID=1137281 RepID=M7MIT5_9FLAO|nr:hypothetical protein [Xanthomarina gelatinilytica]EMQ95006.1 hypothetical protein D778_00003 [Xanthomarina gelatinilytica]